jgi:arylsulfatase A-like enzyme
MKPSRGNILFIVSDQLRADCVRGALSDSLDLPNLRRLMADGVTFANHFTVTTPCGPARASLLTGLYAMNHRSVRNGAPLNARHTNIALEARRGGYEPLLFGYTDTSIDPRGRDPEDPDVRNYEGLMPGFLETVQMRFDTNRAWLADLKAKNYRLPEDYLDIFRPVRADGSASTAITDPALYSAADSDTAFLTDQTIRGLSVREDQGWFAHVTYIRPHPPLVAPVPFNTMYDPTAIPPASYKGGIEGQKAQHPFFEAFFSEPANSGLYIGFDGKMDQIPEEDAGALRAVYFGLTSEVDQHVGRLIDYLKASGQYDETLIIFTSDHGEMLGDHFIWGKETVYDPAFHVPLIIRDPKQRSSAGTVVNALTEAIDLAPTILDWIGLAPPPAFNGVSLLPFLRGEAPAVWRDHVFAEIDFGDPETATRYQRHLGLRLAQCNLAILRENRFKLVHFNGGLPPLVFDLENDPGEHVDLAADPAYAGELARLQARMLDHRMSHADHELSPMKLTESGVKIAPPDA